MAAWDRMPETERSYWIAEWQITATECRDCGLPVEVCSDPNRTFYPYRRVCYATMERETSAERYKRLHEGEGKPEWHDGTFKSWAAKWSPDHPVRYDAGVTIGVADHDLAPWDLFTTERDASPLAPEESPSEEH